MKIINISPGGFTLPYILGICTHIKSCSTYNLDNYEFIGASAGSWAAVYLASDFKVNEDTIYKYSKLFENKGYYYKWRNIGDYLIDEFTNGIEDTNFIKNKKVKIQLSKFKNNKLSCSINDNYNNLNELLKLCYYSSYIPGLSGLKVPKYHGEYFIDGFFTRNDLNFNNEILIYPSMFNRNFTLHDVLGNSNNAIEMYQLGISDAFNNLII